MEKCVYEIFFVFRYSEKEKAELLGAEGVKEGKIVEG